MEHPWLPTSKQIKGLKAKKVRSTSTSTVANATHTVAKLMSLMTSDLTSIQKDKSTEFKNKEAAAAWRW